MQTNTHKHTQLSFPNKNKLTAILSINLQLYNYYKYMISCVKVQKQNKTKIPTLKSKISRTHTPLSSNLSSQQRAHMPQQEPALARHHSNSGISLTKMLLQGGEKNYPLSGTVLGL